MEKLDRTTVSGGDQTPAYLVERGDKMYHLDLVMWDDRVVAGNIIKCQVESVIPTSANRVQHVIVRPIYDKKLQDRRIFTSNYMLFLTKQEVKEYLYKRLLHTQEYLQDILNMVSDSITDLDMDDELIEQT